MVKAPGFHVYEPAPVAIKVTEVPEQIAEEDELAVKVGVGVTENESVVVDLQPKALAPATV